tara:strand:- start:87 stop:512 length:426 start_codon:yes stop_codon:yes gene_type:complete
MNWFQKEILVSAENRGFSLITDKVINQLPELLMYKIGILHLFIKHTSASLAINESADPTVRIDMETHFNKMVPENVSYYTHTIEGDDDMPAHLKSVIIGSSLSMPIHEGKINLGVWQGIYLCEHRNHCQSRKIVATINGDR